MSIDGNEYTARLSVNALCSLETVLDSEITTIVGDFIVKGKKGTVSMRVLRAFVWAMLRDHHPHLTLELAGTLIDQATPKYIVQKVMELMPLTFPDAEESDASRP